VAHRGARLIAGMWHDGRDLVLVAAEVCELTGQMMRQAVAAA